MPSACILFLFFYFAVVETFLGTAHRLGWDFIKRWQQGSSSMHLRGSYENCGHSARGKEKEDNVQSNLWLALTLTLAGEHLRGGWE